MRDRRIFPAVLLCGAVAFAALLLFHFRVYLFPTRVGTHREFFRSCGAIKENEAPAGVLARMHGYVLADGRRTRLVTPELASTGLEPTRDASAEAESTFLFYPATQESAEWCVVYFRNGRVTRTWISPD